LFKKLADIRICGVDDVVVNLFQGGVAGHGVAAQELAAGDVLPRQVDDFALGAAGVGDEGAGADQRIEMPDGVENAADGLGEEDQVGLGNGFGERRAAVDGAGGNGVGDGARGADPGDRPSNPAWRKARPKDEPIRPVPTMATLFM
jgi:hypothetical protein